MPDHLDMTPRNTSRVVKTIREIDVLGCVSLCNGPENTTMSYYSAARAEEKARWACVFCALLGVIVARNHCADTLADKPMTKLALARAGLALTLAFLVACEAISASLNTLAHLALTHF